MLPSSHLHGGSLLFKSNANAPSYLIVLCCKRMQSRYKQVGHSFRRREIDLMVERIEINSSAYLMCKLGCLLLLCRSALPDTSAIQDIVS